MRQLILSAYSPLRVSRCSRATLNRAVPVRHEFLTPEVARPSDFQGMEQRVIAVDYGVGGGMGRIEAGKALLSRRLKRLVRDTGPPTRRAQDRQIILPSQPVPTAPGGGS